LEEKEIYYDENGNKKYDENIKMVYLMEKE